MSVSFSGLDLSFLKTKESQDFIQSMKDRHDGEKRKKRFRGKRSALSAPLVMPDLSAAYGGDGFVSPVDKSLISSRSKLREHNKRHNVRQYGDVKLEEHVAKMDQHVSSAKTAPTEGVNFEWVPKN